MDITPPIGIPLAGFGEGDRRLSFPDLDAHNLHTFFAPSTGVRDRLLARALVLDDGSERVAFLSLDVVASDNHATHAIARKLADRGVAISEDQLITLASHTHSGPGAITPLGLWQLVGTDLYIEAMAELVTTAAADAVERAVLDLQPAELGIGSAQLTGLTHNRREGVSPVLHSSDVDPTLFVIKVDALDQTPIATLYRYAIHGTVLWWDNMALSADVMGEASRFVENELGTGVALFANGAEGDVVPKGRGETDCVQDGETLGTAVRDLRAQIATSSNVDLGFAATSVDMGEPAFYFTRERLGDKIPDWIGRVLDYFSLEITVPLPPLLQDRTFRFNALRVDDRVLVTVPGEAIGFVGKDIEQRGAQLGYTDTIVLGLANGHMAYITNESEYDAGGYEGLATLYGRDTGSKVAAACEAVMQLAK